MPTWISRVFAPIWARHGLALETGRGVVDADDPGRLSRRAGLARTSALLRGNLVAVLRPGIAGCGATWPDGTRRSGSLLVAAAGAVAHLMVGKPRSPARAATDVVLRELGFASRGRRRPDAVVDRLGGVAAVEPEMLRRTAVDTGLVGEELGPPLGDLIALVTAPGLSLEDRAHPVLRTMRCSRAVLIWSSAGIRWPSQFSMTPA